MIFSLKTFDRRVNVQHVTLPHKQKLALLVSSNIFLCRSHKGVNSTFLSSKHCDYIHFLISVWGFWSDSLCYTTKRTGIQKKLNYYNSVEPCGKTDEVLKHECFSMFLLFFQLPLWFVYCLHDIVHLLCHLPAELQYGNYMYTAAFPQ